MRSTLQRAKAETHDVGEIKKRLTSEALAIFDEDIASNRALGKFGGELIADGASRQIGGRGVRLKADFDPAKILGRADADAKFPVRSVA